MKKLTLSTAAFLLLAVQLNAQSEVSVSTNVNTNVSVNSNQQSYAVNKKTTVNFNSNDEQDSDPVKAKTFTKTFTIDKNDKVNLSNQFGGITIKTWDKNEIKVDIDIKAYAKTDDEAQKLLDQVSISASKDGDLVAFKTNMGDRSGNWGSNTRNGKTVWRREAKVYYVVYMPAGNSLTASQQYGNIILDDFSGPTSLKVQYGNLTAGNLTNNNNYISIQYGKGTVKDMGGATIKHQYGGGITIGNVGNLNLDAQYTAVNVNSVNGATSIKHQYGGGTTIGSVSGAMNVNTQYAPIKISNLKGNLTCRSQYGKVIVNDIESGKDIDVDAQYASVSLSFATNYNADFEVRTQYGGFSYGSNVTAKRQGDGERDYSQNKNYSGQIGKGGAAKVIVRTQYNSVTFK